MNSLYPIEIIYYDDISVQSLGSFPVSRKIQAELVEKVQTSKPAAVILKFFYENKTDYDGVFIKTLKSHSNIYTQTTTLFPETKLPMDFDISPFSFKDLDNTGFETSENLLLPQKSLLPFFKGFGLVDIEITEKGKFMDFALFKRVRKRSIPALALKVVSDLTSLKPQYRKNTLMLGEEQIKAPGGRYTIELSRPRELYPEHSFIEVLDGNKSLDFRGKIVIIYVESSETRWVGSRYKSLHNNAEIIADTINSLLKELE